jgi:putative transposase
MVSGVVVRRAFRFRFYPSAAQEVELLRTFGCVRLVYNRALEARSAAWYGEHHRVNYAQTSALLTEWKKTDGLGFLNEVSSVPLQQSLRHLQTAFTAFWEKRSRYPRFKSRKRGRASAEYTRSAFRWRDGRLTLAKMDGPLDIVWSRPLPEGAEPSTVTVSRDPASRALARKQKGSANRVKARLAVARVHARIADRRRDLLHKLSTRLVRENQLVVIEDLAVRTMVKNRSLARAISDASWSQLRSMLEYKCRWYGRDLVVVDRWLPSSKTCSHCGHLLDTLPLRVREWTCPGCGASHDRDVNAARTTLAAGRAVTACGAGVRPTRH